MDLLQEPSHRCITGDRNQAKRDPTSHTPIPELARPIVNAVHGRYLEACKRGERPAIDNPSAAAALLTLAEKCSLAKAGYYPIPPEVIQLGMTPAEHQRHEVFDAVAKQLPDAVGFILESILP